MNKPAHTLSTPNMFRRFYLRHYAAYMQDRYLYWLASAFRILRATNRPETVSQAEAVMPLLPRFRRRAAACNTLLSRCS